MPQDIAVVAAHAVARQYHSNIAGHTSQTPYRPKSAGNKGITAGELQAHQMGIGNQCQLGDQESPAGDSTSSPESPSARAAGTGASEAEQFPHLFKWLRTNNRGRRSKSPQQQQQKQQPAAAHSSSNSRPASAAAGPRPASAAVNRTGSSCSNGRANLQESMHAAPHSRPHSAANSRPVSASLRRHRLQPDSAIVLCPQQPSTQQQESLVAWVPPRPHSSAATHSPSRMHEVSSVAPGQLQHFQSLQPKRVPKWLEGLTGLPPYKQEQGQTGHPKFAAPTSLDIFGIAAPAAAATNPWVVFGAEAPASWQCFGSSGEGGTANTDSRTATPTADRLVGTQELQWSQQQQQHAAGQTAGQHLFQQLPLNNSNPMPRAGLQMLAAGLQQELGRVGAPLELQLPDAAMQQSGAGWSAHEQLAPELLVWDKLLLELCRQVRLECSQRGALLLAAANRQRQLLHSALSVCDGAMAYAHEAAGTQRQYVDTIQDLQQQLHQAQHHIGHLTAAVESRQQTLDLTTAQLEHQQEQLRKGRFHLITEQVEVAKMATERRMADEMDRQLRLCKAGAAGKQQEALQQLQERLLRLVATLAGGDVALKVADALVASAVDTNACTTNAQPPCG